jgi:plasmid stabilization system protein ParE
MAASAYYLSPLAEADLEDIWLYTFQTWSSEQADHYTPRDGFNF